VSNVTGKAILIASAHHRDRVVREATQRLRDLGAVVVVQVVNDGAVDDMRSLAIELLAHEPRIDVLAHVGERSSFDGAVVQPYLLTRLLADRIAHGRGRVLWSVSGAHRAVTLDLDAMPTRGRRARGTYALARALLVHEGARRDARIGWASFDPDPATLVQLCGSDERLRGGHFVDGVRVTDAPAARDAEAAAALWARCAEACRLAP
jgi:hypothetical protein